MIFFNYSKKLKNYLDLTLSEKLKFYPEIYVIEKIETWWIRIGSNIF